MDWRYRDTVLVLCMLAFFVTYVARVAVSPVVPFIRADFAVSNTAIGVALSGMWIAYGVTQFPSGLLADRHGEKAIILLAVGGTAVASVLTAIAPVFAIFAVCAVLIGGMAGLHYSVASTLLTRIYDDIGTALGLHSLGAPLAGLVGPIVAAWIGVRYGWRPAVAFAALLAVPIFVLFFWRVEPTEARRPAEPIGERVELGALLAFLRRPPILFTVVIAISATFAVNALVTFLPTFLVEHRLYSPTAAGIAFSVYYVVRGGGQVGVGWLSDRFGRDSAIGACLLSGAIGMGLFVFGPGLGAAAVALLAAGIGSSFFTAVEPRFMDHLADAERAAGFGLVRTVSVVVGSFGSVAAGAMADLFGWGVSFLAIGAVCLFGLAMLAGNWALRLGY